MRWIVLLAAGSLVAGLPARAAAVSPQSDEFGSATLSGFWTVVDPSAPNSYVSLTERPGFLRVSSTALNGGGDYCACDNHNAPRVTQPCSGDWTLEVRMEFAPTFNYQGAGIFAPFPTTGDSGAWRIAERAYYPDGGGQVVRCLGAYVPYSGTVTYFRIVKLADTLSGYWSADGVNWNFNGRVSQFPSSLGVFAVCHDWNGGNTAPAVADFDYFRVTGATQPAPVSFCDGFDGSSLAPPSRWDPFATACGAPAEVGGELQLAQTGGCADSYVAVELDTARYVVAGDFDITVNYRLPDYTVPADPEDRATGLKVMDTSQGQYATIERYNRALGDCNPGTQNYKAWFTNSQNCFSGVHWAATSDAAGSLRLTRTGTTVTEYYWNGGWVALNSQSMPDVPVRPVLFALDPTGTSAFDVRYDSLCINATVVTAVGDAPSDRGLRLEAGPNPFPAATQLSFVLPEAGPVRLEVFDVLGRRVALILNESMSAGTHTVFWRPAAVRPGMLMVRLRSGGQAVTRRLLLAR